MPNGTQIEDEETLLRVISHNETVLVFFYTKWCHECQRMMNTYEQISRSPPSGIQRCYQVDLDEIMILFLLSVQQQRLSAVSSVNEEHPLEDSSRPHCEGRYEERAKHRLPIFGNKPFADVESGCIFQPTPDENGLTIARTNYGTSIFFGIHFMPDPEKKSRFESAMFSVTFSQDDGQQGNQQLPLTIYELTPSEDSNPVPPNEGTNVPIDQSRVEGSDWSSDETTSIVRGSGIHSSTAVWSIVEDPAQSQHHRGLDAHCTLSVVLPPGTTRLGIEYWSKAVIVSEHTLLGGMKRILEAGTPKSPYYRVMDLRVVMVNATRED
ncbi:hypothetical protein C8J56DRAFT_900639 [Mycena floridula]|nr:hypothetical protein C8J56DRAFT_900639 [Mycena floridula]